MRTDRSIRRPSSLFLPLLLAAALACQGGEQAPPADEDPQAASRAASADTAAFESAVDSLRQAFLDAYNGGDTQRLAALYAEDAVYLPSDAPPVSGRGSIRGYFNQSLAAGATLEVEPHELRALGSGWASDHGRYTVTVTPEGAEEETTTRGSYLILLRDTPQGWKLFRHASTLDSVPSGPGGG